MTRTIQSLYILLIALTFVACSKQKDKVIIEGEIEGVNEADLFVYCDDPEQFYGVDTIKMKKGEFTYERKIAGPMVLTLLYPNFSSTLIVAAPGEKIKMKGNAAKLGEAEISGSDENQLLTDFRQDNAEKREADAVMAAENFVRSHPKTLAAYAVYKRYFALAQSPDPQTALSLIDLLRKSQPRNIAIAGTAERLTPIFKASQGQQLPDFSARTLGGGTVSLSSIKGKPTLILFWATWSNDAFDATRRLRRITRAYAGRLNAIAFSLDVNPKMASQRAKADSLTCPVVCDGRAFNSPTAKAFGVKYVPGNLLLDASGRVIDRDIPLEMLESRIGQVVK